MTAHRKSSSRAPWLALVLTVGACSDAVGTPVDFAIVHPPDQDPYAGGSRMVVALEPPEDVVPIEQRRFPVNARSGEAPLVPDGEGWRFRVDVLAGDLLLSRGRSFPFAVLDGTPPERPPNVGVGILGTIAPATGDPAPSERVVIGVAAEGGALLATADGRLYRYEAHDEEPSEEPDGLGSLRVTSVVPGRAGASWVALDQGLLLAVGGASGGASVHGADGELVASLEDPALEAQRFGAAVAAVPGTRAALILGGVPALGAAPVSDILRVELEPGEGGPRLRVEALPVALRVPRRDAAAIGVPVQDEVQPCPCVRVVVYGGTDGSGPVSTIESIDPDGIAHPMALDVDGALGGAAAVAPDTGLLILAGGGGASDAPVDLVRAIDVRAGALRRISPDPPRLATPRSHAAAVRFGRGLVLLSGGVGPLDRPLASTELYDFETDRFGEAASSGTLPVGMPAPRAVAMADGTVLVADASGLGVYFPPRGGGLGVAGL